MGSSDEARYAAEVAGMWSTQHLLPAMAEMRVPISLFSGLITAVLFEITESFGLLMLVSRQVTAQHDWTTGDPVQCCPNTDDYVRLCRVANCQVLCHGPGSHTTRQVPGMSK